MHEGHRERLKRRFIKDGLDSFEDHNVLELLLFYCIPYRDTNEISHRLLERFGSISGVLEASMSELELIDGVGEHTAALITALPKIFAEYQRDKRRNGGMRSLIGLADFAAECFYGVSDNRFLLICIDNNRSIINFRFISEYNEENFAECLRVMAKLLLASKSTAAVVAHNHVIGNAVPSRMDLKNTVEIYEVFKNLGIKLLDNVIVDSDGQYTSMRAEPKKYGIYLGMS